MVEVCISDIYTARTKSDFFDRLKKFIKQGSILGCGAEDFADFETVYMLAHCTDDPFIRWFQEEILEKAEEIPNKALREYWWKLFSQTDKINKNIFRRLLAWDITDSECNSQSILKRPGNPVRQKGGEV